MSASVRYTGADVQGLKLLSFAFHRACDVSWTQRARGWRVVVFDRMQAWVPGRAVVFWWRTSALARSCLGTTPLSPHRVVAAGTACGRTRASAWGRGRRSSEMGVQFLETRIDAVNARGSTFAQSMQHLFVG